MEITEWIMTKIAFEMSFNTFEEFWQVKLVGSILQEEKIRWAKPISQSKQNKTNNWSSEISWVWLK